MTWFRHRVLSLLNLCLGESFPPLLLGERDSAVVVIGNDDFIFVVFDFNGWTATCCAAQLDECAVSLSILSFSHSNIFSCCVIDEELFQHLLVVLPEHYHRRSKGTSDRRPRVR